MKNVKFIAFLLCLVFFQLNTIRAQQVCNELRTDDYAIIKNLVAKDGIYYLTVDVVQLIDVEGEPFPIFQNENPKLRTFLIDPDTEWLFCQGNGSENYKIRNLIKKRNLLIESLMIYSAKDGRITDSYHLSCAN